VALERWNPSDTYTRQEKFILSRLRRTRKLFAFLRDHRREIFDDAFQVELESMYRDSGAGKPPKAPALMAMAVLMQGYHGVSDAEAVELTMLDLRWQMVLDCLGSTEPAFGQGPLCDFRERLIRTDMDRRLLERTVEVARRTKEFDWRKLPKTLRLAIDSSPLVGAGRVEDTVNLLAHAGRKIVTCIAKLVGLPEQQVCLEAGIPLLAEGSIKKALDYTWTDAEDKAEAVSRLVGQLAALERWINRRLPEATATPPLKEHLDTLHQVMGQNLEPDPTGGGSDRKRVLKGVAEERRVSIEDPQMRHGRKSKSKLFNGYKRHVATDLDTDLILACAVTPANRPEEEGCAGIEADLLHQNRTVDELYIDRGYINAPLVGVVLARRGEVICRPWVSRNGELFAKSDFTLDMRARTITCPAGAKQPLALGTIVEFDPTRCDGCSLRSRCTDAASGRGRTVAIAENEALQQRLRKLAATPKGRDRIRQRVPVEHRLAHISQRQGNRARYRGVRKNVFDLRRAAGIQNLETIDRTIRTVEAARKAA
jgi:Transposase DDE domain/Transposase domain (DUF772)